MIRNDSNDANGYSFGIKSQVSPILSIQYFIFGKWLLHRGAGLYE